MTSLAQDFLNGFLNGFLNRFLNRFLNCFLNRFLKLKSHLGLGGGLRPQVRADMSPTLFPASGHLGLSWVQSIHDVFVGPSGASYIHVIQGHVRLSRP